MPIARPALVVLADLCRRKHVGLGFDGTGAQQDFKMGLTGGNGESGWVGDDLGTKPAKVEGGLRVAELGEGVRA